MIESLLLGFARATTRSPRRTWALLALITLGAVLLLPRFRINPDIASLLPADLPAVELTRELGGDTSRAMFVTLRGTNIAEHLPAVISALENSPHLETVDATLDSLIGSRAKLIAEAPVHYLSEDDLRALEARIAGIERMMAIEESRDILAQDPLAGSELVQRDPLGVRWILDDRVGLPEGFATDTPYILLDDESLALLRVTGTREPFDIEFSNLLVADVEQRIATLEIPGLESLGLLGGYASARSDAARIKSDLSSSLYFSIPLILLFLTISTRSLLRAHLYLLPVLLAVLWALGYGGALLGPLTPLAISSAAILIGLGVDFAIHYAGRLEQELALHDRIGAVERAHVGTGRAILAGMATTVAAFLSFCFGSFPGLFGFGVLLAMGLCFSFLATLMLLPLLAGRLHGRQEKISPLIRAAQRVTRSRIAQPVTYSFVALAAVGWALAFAGGLRFNADPSFLRPAAENHAAQELTAALGFSPLPVLVLTPADDSPDSLRANIDALTKADRIRFADGAHAMHLGEQQQQRIAAFRDRTSGWVEGALADFETVGFRAESMRPILEEQAALLLADPSPSPADFQIKWREQMWWKDTLYASGSLSDPAQRAEFRRILQYRLADTQQVVNPYGLADELAPVLSHDLILSLSICAAAVLLLVLFWIGSLSGAVMALVPVFVGLGVALGALVVLRIPLHPGNFIAIPLILGLGVDDGIHMVLRSRERIASPNSSPLANTGQAIWRTSATTALGFGSLITAQSPALASLGGIALIGVLVCFVTSVLVLPPWLETRDAHSA